MIPCCLSIISRKEYENRLGAGLVGGDQGKHHRCPNDANEAHELIQKMESNTCHFAIGYGARMAPCCLSIISREEYENRLGAGLVGGDQGKHHRCPNDANEAHDLIQKMEANNKKAIEEGQLCGGRVAHGPIPCAEGLTCVGRGQEVDIPGTCRRTGGSCPNNDAVTCLV